MKIPISNIQYPKRAGFTLLELLVAITIFSGMIILAFGAFARTANSAAQSNTVRERTEAARSLIDQISTDFRYVVETETPAGCLAPPQVPVGGVWKGFCLNPVSQALNSVHLLIQYPNETTFVGKTYFVTTVGSNFTVQVAEQRDCVSANDCAATIVGAKTSLTTTYVLDDQNVFSGQAQTPLGDGFLRLSLTIKPAGTAAKCNQISTGSCYKITTTLVPGGF